MSRVVFYTHFKEKLVKKSDSSDPELSKAGGKRCVTLDNSDSKRFEYIFGNISQFTFSAAKFLLL